MPADIQRTNPFDPNPGAYQAGAQLAQLLAQLLEPTEQVERQTATRKTHYDPQGRVSVVEEQIVTERIIRRS
ncbi:hypothetical protein [Streptomyces cinereoruber]|uniref:hypothetical protein n=1 Tax=Streptomyces cinereoruber TaxID=67260 RepID=UPI003642C423